MKEVINNNNKKNNNDNTGVWADKSQYIVTNIYKTKLSS